MFFNKRNKELKLAVKALQESTFLSHNTMFNTGEFPIKVSLSGEGTGFSYPEMKEILPNPIVTIDYNYSYGQYEICSLGFFGDPIELPSSLYSSHEMKSWITLYTKMIVIRYGNIKNKVEKYLGIMHIRLLSLGYKVVEFNGNQLRYGKVDSDYDEPFNYITVLVTFDASNVSVSYPHSSSVGYLVDKFSFKEAREGKVIDFLVNRNLECNNKEEVTSMDQELHGDKLGLLFDAMFSKAKKLALDSDVLSICGIRNDSDQDSGAPQHSFILGDRNKTIFDVTLQDAYVMSGLYNGARCKGKITMHYGDVDEVAHTETLLESDYVKHVKYYNDSFLRTIQDVMISSMEGSND